MSLLPGGIQTTLGGDLLTSRLLKAVEETKSQTK